MEVLKENARISLWGELVGDEVSRITARPPTVKVRKGGPLLLVGQSLVVPPVIEPPPGVAKRRLSR